MASNFSNTSLTQFCPAMFEIDITNTLGCEYVEMFNDMARFLMIQIGIQIMLCMSDPERYSLFSGEFIVLLFFRYDRRDALLACSA